MGPEVVVAVVSAVVALLGAVVAGNGRSTVTTWSR